MIYKLFAYYTKFDRYGRYEDYDLYYVDPKTGEKVEDRIDRLITVGGYDYVEVVEVN